MTKHELENIMEIGDEVEFVRGKKKGQRGKIAGQKNYRQLCVEVNGEITPTWHANLRLTKVKRSKKITISEPPTNFERYFNDVSIHYSNKYKEYNFVFVKAQVNWFKDTLQIRGHIFLNEVYDAFGFPRTASGAITGWMYKEGDNIDNFITFSEDELYEYIRIMFRTQGIIFNKIEEEEVTYEITGNRATNESAD